MADDPQTRFHKWYVMPLEKIGELPNGDGAFVALATSCFLYERYAVAVIRETGGTANPDSKIQQLANDFQIDQPTAKAFWDVIRNGMLHQGMPKTSAHGRNTLPGWAIHNDFKQPIKLGKVNGSDSLLIQPWLFTQRVIQLWQENLTLIDKNSSFPWANVADMMIDYGDS